MEALEVIYKEVENLSREKVMEIVSTLIKVDTSVPPGNTYREYIDVISPFFEKLGYELEEVLVPKEIVEKWEVPLKGPRVNLVASKNYGQETDLNLYRYKR